MASKSQIIKSLQPGYSYIDGLVQVRRNSSALAMELCLSCINPSIYASDNSVIIGLGNDLSPVRCQSLNRTSDD